LQIEVHDRPAEFAEGNMFVIPRGMRHNPVAEQECHIKLIEKKITLHTQDTITIKHTFFGRSASRNMRALQNVAKKNEAESQLDAF
jgi:hypothetical protein